MCPSSTSEPMNQKIIGPLALALSLSLAACDDATTVADAGPLTLMLTDDAGDVKMAIVTIARIELVGDGQPVVLAEDLLPIDLVPLENDVAPLVEDLMIPGGTYSQLRFVIPAACIRVEQADPIELTYASSDDFDECGTPDGRLQIPSFAQTGIKVNLPGGSIRVDGESKILLLDFDVAESFGHQAGQSDSWVMTPVIHAEDISLSGSIVVELSLATGFDASDFRATLTNGTGTESEPFVEAGGAGGTYVAPFHYLHAGEYEVSVELEAGVVLDFTLSPEAPQNVTLGSGEQVTVAFEVGPPPSP